jgi:hypothetical protein
MQVGSTSDIGEEDHRDTLGMYRDAMQVGSTSEIGEEYLTDAMQIGSTSDIGVVLQSCHTGRE